jgi:hypothetical protein
VNVDATKAVDFSWRRRAIVSTILGTFTLLGIGVIDARAQEAPPPENTRPLVTGITGGFEGNPLAFQAIADTGAQFVHIDVDWNQIAPTTEPEEWQPTEPSDPHYNWSSLDPLVTEAVQAGLTPVLMVDSAPAWAQRTCNSQLCSPIPAKLAAFTTAAARRYSGEFDGLPLVRYWQGWNEPNLSLFFNPQFKRGKPTSPQLYRKIINAFYFAVKSVNPSDLVIAAGLGPIERFPLTIGPLSFARSLLCMTGGRHPHRAPGNCEGGVHFDIFDIHPYTTGGPAREGEANDVELGSLGRLQQLLTAADRAGRLHGEYKQTPLWITEFAWASKPPNRHGLAMKILVRWAAEALYVSWRAGVTHFFWFGLHDEPAYRHFFFSETYQTGLYFDGPSIAKDRPKKRLLNTFRFPFVAYAHKNGIFFWGRTPYSKSGKAEIQLLKEGSWRTASIINAKPTGIFSGVVRTTYGRNLQGEARARYVREISIPSETSVSSGIETSVPFSLHPVKEFYQPPFG